MKSQCSPIIVNRALVDHKFFSKKVKIESLLVTSVYSGEVAVLMVFDKMRLFYAACLTKVGVLDQVHYVSICSAIIYRILFIGKKTVKETLSNSLMNSTFVSFRKVDD